MGDIDFISIFAIYFNSIRLCADGLYLQINKIHSIISMYDILELNDKLLADLRQIAKTLNIKRVESYKKQELIYKILDQQALVAAQSEPVVEPAAPEAAAPG